MTIGRRDGLGRILPGGASVNSLPSLRPVTLSEFRAECETLYDSYNYRSGVSDLAWSSRRQFDEWLANEVKARFPEAQP